MMHLRKLVVGLRHALHTSRPAVQRANSTGGDSLSYDKDPQPLFTDPETQKLLQSMTQLSLAKVFRKRTARDNSMEYKFMTTEQLEEEFRATIEHAHARLQMPPVVRVKDDKQRVISQDPALTGFSDMKFVFTDITYGLRQTARKVVIRQVDGTLEYAPLDVTKRMNQLYFPLRGRKMRTPLMFEDEHFRRCLDEHKYEFVLDRLAIQYEPYEREYHRLCSTVYQHLNESKQFDMLRSTRHFGPMAFFYAWHRCIDDLLYDMIRHDLLVNGAELVALLYKIHGLQTDYKTLLRRLEAVYGGREPALAELHKSIAKTTDDIHEEIQTAIGKTKTDFDADDWCLDFIETYIKAHALKKVQLELAVQTLKEINAEKRQLYEGLSKAHGMQ